jgi:nitrite reductase/ring-hydroxylating ferredoxin subunit
LDDEKLMTRAEFFAWLKSKANLRSLGSAYGSFLALVDEGKETVRSACEDEKWTAVCKYEELGKRPRIVLSSGRPVYVYKNDEAVMAYHAECPEDKNFLRWSDTQNHFYCPVCDAVFSPEGKNEVDGKSLAGWPCRIEKEVVYLKVQK